MKITIIGAGSTYTPELIDGFLTRADRLDVSEFYMMDIDSRKNGIISALARRMIAAKGLNIPVVETTCLDEAISGASYVVAQIRVGQLPARVLDEKIPQKYDFIGQETTGIGGFFKALRTLPVMEEVAQIIDAKAPGAWLINFSNPSGILAEMLTGRGNIRSIGLCNAPIGIEKLLRKKLKDSQELDLDYVGLNHFNWVTGVYADGKAVNLLEDEDIMAHSGAFDKDFLRRIGGIPSYYLNNYYNRDKVLADQKANPTTRGEDCMAIEEDLLKLYQDENLKEKPALLDKRGGAFYSEAAVSLINAIVNDTNTVHVINTVNHGKIPFLSPTDVAEVKCIVGKNGPRPLPLVNPDISKHIQGMILAIKAYEKLTIKAGLEGDYDAGLAALMTHPLLGDYHRTKAAYDEMLEAHRKYLPRFFK
ncbi:MAG: 6-phospho-beta-glucosidase [Defluviitaleaceae bacterium]|nr:6-phospho-beta-glucosidase [Defluviitaleaceae bacterium]